MLSRVHRWIGLALCLALLIMSISGSLLMFKREYLLLTIPAAQETLDFSAPALVNAVDRIQASYAVHEVRFIQLHSEGLSIHKVFLSGKRYALHAQDGTQIQVWQANQRIEDWLLDLHHRFLLGNTIGLNIAGFSGIILVPLMLVGACLWWPRRKSLRIGILPKYASRDAWRISHGNLGVLFLLPILVLAISGVILVYPKEARSLLLDGFGPPQPATTYFQQVAQQPELLSALQTAANYFPASQARWISMPSADNAAYSIGLKRDGAWNVMGQTSIRFFEDGRVQIKPADKQRLSLQAFDFAYPLHAGKLPWYLRVCLSIVGLALTFLCILGVRSTLLKS